MRKSPALVRPQISKGEGARSVYILLGGPKWSEGCSTLFTNAIFLFLFFFTNSSFFAPSAQRTHTYIYVTSFASELCLYCKSTVEFEKKLQISFFDIQPFSPLAVLRGIILKGNLDFYL